MFNLRAVIAATLAIALLGSAPAYAELKIAILNVERAILESEEAQGMIEDFNQSSASARTEIEGLQGGLLKLQERVRQDGEVMSDDEKQRIAKDAEDKQIDLEYRVQRLRKDMEDKRKEVLGSMAEKFDSVVKDLIDVEGYDLVLPRQTALWVNPKHDVTRKVTEKLNERNN